MNREEAVVRQPVEAAQQSAGLQRRAVGLVGRRVVLRPVSWGSRLAVAYVYPTAAYGQYVQAPGEPTPENPAAAGATGYPAGINPYKYAYPTRGAGSYYYATAYNSGYYTTGCYEVNACCRCSRRRCTLFGGMCYGCSPGCYTSIPAPCPSTCAYVDPCGNMIAPPAFGTPTPVPSTAPPAAAPPTPSPAPENGAPPQPVEKKVTPAPQANLYPRIPGLPPDA
jgi:hypothetical protein